MVGSLLRHRSRILTQSTLAGACGVLWLVATGLLLARQIDHPSKFGVAACVVLVAAPVLALNFRRLPAYLIGMYAALLPMNSLFVTGTGATVGKFVGMAVAGGTLLVLFASRRTAPPARSLGVLAVLLFYVGTTIFWSVDASKAFSSYIQFLNYVLLYVIISLYPVRFDGLKIILLFMVAGAAASALYGDLLYFHGQQVFGPRLFIGHDAATSVDPNEYASTLIAPITVTLLLFLGARATLVKVGYLGILALLFSSLMISGSRGSTIGLAAVVLFVLWRSRYRLQTFAMLVVAIAGVVSSPVGQRLMSADAVTGDGRTEIWKVAIASLSQYWLLGAGVGNFQVAFDQYYLTTWHLLPGWDRAAHSVFLQSAVEYGALGFGLVLLFWYLVFVELRGVERDPVFGDVSIAIRASVLGLFVAGFSLDLLAYKETWLVFSLVALTRSAFLADQSPRAAERIDETARTASRVSVPAVDR